MSDSYTEVIVTLNKDGNISHFRKDSFDENSKSTGFVEVRLIAGNDFEHISENSGRNIKTEDNKKSTLSTLEYFVSQPHLKKLTIQEEAIEGVIKDKFPYKEKYLSYAVNKLITEKILPQKATSDENNLLAPKTKLEEISGSRYLKQKGFGFDPN